MSLEHHARLCEIGLDPALWSSTTIQVRTPEEMARYIKVALDARDAGTADPFVIVLRTSGEIIGTTRFHSIAPAHLRREIGFTWISARWQRQGISTESKRLLLAHAFDVEGCQRVEFKADADNVASCAALERLGATKEGILRSYMHSDRAGMRDVAIFSIVASDWQRLKGSRT